MNLKWLPLTTLSLVQLQSTDGFLTSLLQWIGNNDTDPNIRQAMAIFFKNRIIRGWEVMETSVVPVGPQDRDFVKANLVAIMVLVDSKLRYLIIGEQKKRDAGAEG